MLEALEATHADSAVTALDLVAPPLAPGRVRWLQDRIDDLDALERARLPEYDLVFHLASVPGGLAEREPGLGRRVNLDASLDLFDRLASGGRRPRVVYASSIAVYGEVDDAPVGAETPTRPASSYGTHKRMTEMALADHTRRGDISGVAVRLPGLIARPERAAGFGSAFMSELPRAVAAGRSYVCPVSPQAVAWWMSVSCAAANLAHAAIANTCGNLQLPALRLSVAEIVDCLARIYGEERRALVSFRPDPRVERDFGRFPALATAREEALGFVHDGDATNLLQKALNA